MNSIDYNGKIYDKNWFAHQGLLKGAVINVDMTAKPNEKRGIAPIRLSLFNF